MFKITIPQQVNALSTTEVTQRSSLKISIKSICNKSLSKKLQSLAEKCRRFSQEFKEHATNKKSLGDQPTSVRSSSLTKSESELGSARSLASDDTQSLTSSQMDLTKVNLEDNDSVFITLESSSEVAVKTAASIPPAPPLPQAGNIPEAPELPRQKTAVESRMSTDSRSKLMEEIRQGVKLRSTPKSPAGTNSAVDAHSKLMQELLTSGNQLKKVNPSDIPVPPPLPAALGHKPTDGRNALLSEISGFSKDRLRKTGSQESLAQKQELQKSENVDHSYGLLLSEEMFSLGAKLTESELVKLADTLSEYLFKAADIDWTQVISEQTRNLTQKSMLEGELESTPKYVQAFCQELLKFPDCYKSADVISAESSSSNSASIIEVALKRLQAGRSRLFSTTDAKGTKELKKGDAILESAMSAARAAMSAEEKSALLAGSVKSATFQVFCELPCMEGFTEQNGKAALSALRSAFYQSISSTETAQQDIAKFIKENLASGFSRYQYLGLSSRIAELEAQLAALTAKQG
ncbi:WH2 domain-containing protein [Vibrio cholerae]